MTANRKGVTVVETLVATVVFSVGVTGMVGTAALLTRLDGRAGRTSRAAFFAQQSLESLRASAATFTGCAALTSGSDSTGIYHRTWTVTATGSTQRVQIVITYPIQEQLTRADTLGTTIQC